MLGGENGLEPNVSAISPAGGKIYPHTEVLREPLRQSRPAPAYRHVDTGDPLYGLSSNNLSSIRLVSGPFCTPRAPKLYIAT